MRLLAIRGVLIGLCLTLPTGCGDRTGTPANNRAAAELVIRKGGSVRVEGVSYPIDRLAQLPAGDLVLKSVDLAEKKFTDEDLQALTDLKALEKLNLYGTGITDKGIDLLLPLDALTELELSYTLLTDDGFQKLKELKSLEKLTLFGTKISDDSVKSFQLRRSDVKIYR
ncbi:MAG TPA: hypothetical protein VLA12_01585 [Planctomycetaceae bacterium]|nr:hypothetical protein [Planctomycetaceae bacterium]